MLNQKDSNRRSHLDDEDVHWQAVGQKDGPKKAINLPN